MYLNISSVANTITLLIAIHQYSIKHLEEYDLEHFNCLLKLGILTDIMCRKEISPKLEGMECIIYHLDVWVIKNTSTWMLVLISH